MSVAEDDAPGTAKKQLRPATPGLGRDETDDDGGAQNAQSL
jgi:hypothetical protein